MGAQSLGIPSGRTTKIVSVANSATANTSVTVLSLTGPGRLSTLWVNQGTGINTLTIVLDGTTYTLTGQGYVYMNTTNSPTLQANTAPNDGYTDMQFKSSCTISTSNSVASQGFVNVQYEQ